MSEPRKSSDHRPDGTHSYVADIVLLALGVISLAVVFLMEFPAVRAMYGI